MIAHGAVAPAPTWASLATAWTYEPAVIAGVVAAGASYALAVRRVGGAPWGRGLFFFAGLAVAAVALMGPPAAYDGTLFAAHMVQHLLLMLVAAPLLLLGAPVTLALRALPPAPRRVVSDVRRFVPGRVVAWPAFAWTLLVATLWSTHLTAFYDLALESNLLHGVEHALYVAVALLFWWPIVGVDPGARTLAFPVRLVYLLLAMPAQVFLGLALYSAEGPLYDHYATLQRTWGPSVLSDQQAGALAMWVGADLVMVAALALVARAWIRRDRLDAARVDRRLARLSH